MPHRARCPESAASALRGTGLARAALMLTSRVLRLRTLFSALVGTLGAAALPACSELTIVPSEFDTNVCDDELAGVTPSEPVDYLAVRTDTNPPGSEPTVPPETTVERGTPCATAQDKAACKSKLDALRPADLQSPKGVDFFQGHYVVFTRGDEVGAITAIADLQTFLAPFENPKDGALLLEEFTEHRVSCDGSNARAAGKGFEFRTETGVACGSGTHLDANIVAISPAGAISIVKTERLEDGDDNCAIGRRPEGYVPIARGASLGEYLAMSAELEASSVPAFRRLARELRAHGAPPELVSRAVKAARDEIRHARLTRRLAQRFGGAPELPKIGKLPVRSLEAIAEENAREGCVRETFGALLASVQAHRAADAGIRAAMEAIAVDETEHAALAWDVAAWLETQLDGAARAVARQAKQSAYASLLDHVGAAASPREGESAPRSAAARLAATDVLQLGLPSPREELQLLQGLARELFAEAA
jgi:bacterioferritin (cytochrome b1)